MPAMIEGSSGGPRDYYCCDVRNHIWRSLDEVRDDFGEIESIDDLDYVSKGLLPSLTVGSASRGNKNLTDGKKSLNDWAIMSEK